jgi:DNA polymerase III epsilon subunit-like protein
VTVAFVDTETTGLDPERHEIWEVGLILPDGSEHSWQLPVDLSRADAIALNVGQFHERRKEAWKDGYTDADWLAEFSQRFVALTRGLHLAGCVVSFDAERLAKLLRANGECPMWHYHLIDSEALVAGLLGIAPPWRSSDLSLAVGVDPEQFDRHSALGDARWAKAMYEAVMAWKR